MAVGVPAMARSSALVALSLLVGSGCGLFRRSDEPRPAPAPSARIVAPSTSRDLVRAMRSRYGGRWYSTLSFMQQNTRYLAGGREDRNTWAEYVSVPGKLRIEFAPGTAGSGVLFENGRVHTFVDGRRIDTRRQSNPLLFLTADIYVLPLGEALRRLASLGVATARFHEARWRGRRVFITGAESGDMRSTQAWIGAETMTVVRWIERDSRGGRSLVTDTHLGEYRIVNGYPIPHEIVAHRDGRPYLRESYSRVRVNPRLSPALFNPARWRTAARPGD